MTVAGAEPASTTVVRAAALGHDAVDRLVAPAPAERLAVLRVLVGSFALVYLAAYTPQIWRMAAFADYRFEPVGVFGWLADPLSAALVRAGLVFALTAGIAFVAGWQFRLTGPAFALALLFLTTTRNSWSQVWHTENLVVMHALVLAFAPSALALSMDAYRRSERDRTSRDTRPDWRHGFAPRLMSIITVCTYVAAGWAKVHNAGGSWFGGDPLRYQVAYDNVRKAVLGAPFSGLADTFLHHAWLFAPLAFLTIAVELGAPLALFGRIARWTWSIAAWAFHVGILALMHIVFPYPLSGIAFASLFHVEVLARPFARMAPSSPDDRHADRAH